MSYEIGSGGVLLVTSISNIWQGHALLLISKRRVITVALQRSVTRRLTKERYSQRTCLCGSGRGVLRTDSWRAAVMPLLQGGFVIITYLQPLLGRRCTRQHVCLSRVHISGLATGLMICVQDAVLAGKISVVHQECKQWSSHLMWILIWLAGRIGSPHLGYGV